MTSVEDLISRVQNTVPPKLFRPTKHPGVFEIPSSSILRARRTSQIMATRRLVVRELIAALPTVFLWSGDWSGQAADALGTPTIGGAETALWSLKDEAQAQSVVPTLHEGGWALFFFVAQPAALRVPEFLPASPAAVVGFVDQIGAGAAVLSWYDDTEWLIAFSGEDRVAEAKIAP